MISVLDLAPLNKSSVLSYLDKNGTLPTRYARAQILFYATEEPYVEDFLVGPLPVSSKTTYEPYDYYTTKGTSKIRVYDADEDAMYTFYQECLATVSDVIEDIYNATYDSFDAWGIDPL
jgi:primary-amine oxidase